MKLTKRKNEVLRICAVMAFLVSLVPICELGSNLNGASSEMEFHGKNLVCALGGIEGGYSLDTDMNYEILQSFAKDHHCNIEIIAARDAASYTDSLKAGKVDLVVLPAEMEAEGLSLSKPVNGHSVWAVKDGNGCRIKNLNRWISYYENSDEYANLQSKYARSYNPHTRAEKGIVSKTASPYDALLKKYAGELGWDWRMLAAVAYQESKFAIGTRSSRGAVGLMQVMPSTGKVYGVDNLLDPENNIMAGTRHLLRLQNMMKKQGLEGEELVKFTLAAYNAGEGRILDCRNFAASRNLDNSKWEEIVSVIPLMREDSILSEESVKLGKFKGTETIAYVDSVMALYHDICQTVM